MKHVLNVFSGLILIVLLSSLTGCQNKEKVEVNREIEKENIHALNITVDMLTTEKDLSCDMILTNETIADTAIYKGKLYGFCCEHCKNEFKKNPELLLAKLKEENQ
jgi:YHS domain-containing protein